MVSVTSRYVLNLKDHRRPRLTLSPMRRYVFLGISILLGASLAAGISVTEHPFRDHPVGTVFFLILFAVSLGMTFLADSWIFDITEHVILRTLGILGAAFITRSYPLDNLDRVQVEGVRLLSESFVPKHKVSRSYFEKRKLYFKMVLIISGRRVVIDDGTDGEHMVQMGTALAHALGVKYSFVEL